MNNTTSVNDKYAQTFDIFITHCLRLYAIR